MSDLLEVLPDFDSKPFSHLFHSLEKNNINVSDLLTLDPKEIARRCPLPSADVQKLCAKVIHSLQKEVHGGLRKMRKIIPTKSTITISDGDKGDFRAGQRLEPIGSVNTAKNASTSGEVKNGLLPQKSIASNPQLAVKTLDSALDTALRGGFRPGHITEIVGESAVGKTQFVLGLLLSAQLPSPKGLGKAAMYVSTEAKLNTKRLSEMLYSHPEYQKLHPSERPSMDHVHATLITDLEEQEHILHYQLPIAVQRFNVGLVVIDSVAANFRAEHETRTPAGLADRASDLVRLGSALRRTAIENNVVVIVTNQVSDRFDDSGTKSSQFIFRASSPATSSSPAMRGSQLPPAIAERRTETQSLDHQQRFFTGWGDRKESNHESLKTPALGLAWANQISARIILKMESERQEYAGGNIWRDKKKSRSLAVVFAPWAPPTNLPIRYDITEQGVISISEKEVAEFSALSKEHPELLNPEFWADDDEFPCASSTSGQETQYVAAK